MSQARRTGSDQPIRELIEAAEQESRYYPTDWRARFTLGQAYARLYETEGLEEYRQKAIDYLEQALLLYPWFEDAKDMLDTLGALDALNAL